MFSIARYWNTAIRSFPKVLPVPYWRLEAFSGVFAFDSEEPCGMVLSATNTFT